MCEAKFWEKHAFRTKKLDDDVVVREAKNHGKSPGP